MAEISMPSATDTTADASKSAAAERSTRLRALGEAALANVNDPAALDAAIAALGEGIDDAGVAQVRGTVEAVRSGAITAQQAKLVLEEQTKIPAAPAAAPAAAGALATPEGAIAAAATEKAVVAGAAGPEGSGVVAITPNTLTAAGVSEDGKTAGALAVATGENAPTVDKNAVVNAILNKNGFASAKTDSAMALGGSTKTTAA